MFKKKEEFTMESIDSLIGENLKITGNIEGKGNLRIDGTVEGDIIYEGNVVIGEDGKVIGNIKASAVSLSGTVNGNVASSSRIEIFENGTLIGDLEAPVLVIHENARFEGNCKMPNKSRNDTHKEKAKAENPQ
ncbi:MAG TPA: polymer-forming cytoskeletal protein [Tissierellaceae bacterium]